MPLRLFDKKIHLIALIVIVHLVFSYYFIPKYWAAAVGNLLIVLLSYFTWHRKFVFWTGIKLTFNEVLFTFVITASFLTASILLIKKIDHSVQLEFHTGSYKSLIHTIFYTLNEEIIMGALLLNGIQYRWEKTADWKISIIVALCFTIIHFIFFKLIFQNSGNLSLITVFSLYGVGILRNNLILSTGHIGYSWAIHFGWIFPMLGCTHFNISTEQVLTDFESFNLYLGDLRTLLIILVLSTVSFIALNKKSIFS